MAQGYRGNLRIAAGITVALFFAAFVVWNFGQAEQLALSGVNLERTADGVVLSGNVRNRESRTPRASIEVTFFGPDGREIRKEIVELHDLEAGGERPFRTRPVRGLEVGSYSVYANVGRNPYGN